LNKSWVPLTKTYLSGRPFFFTSVAEDKLAGPLQRQGFTDFQRQLLKL